MVDVKIVVIGKIDPELNLRKVKKWKSCLFKVDNKIDQFVSNLVPDLDNPAFGYSDVNLKMNLPSIEKLHSCSKGDGGFDIVFYLMDVPIQDNWYSRILDKNRIVITYFQAKEMLKDDKVPLENYLIEHIYSYSLLFLQKNGEELTANDEIVMSHDARRACIYDMNGIKTDIIDSCLSPTICDTCRLKMLQKNIPVNLITSIEQELKSLKRSTYYSIILFLKKHPIISLILSALSAVALGVLSNILYCILKNYVCH